MSSAKLDIIWSPVHHDKFIIWGPDITLYQVSNIQEIEQTTYMPISSTHGATVLASQSANGVHCVDISAVPEQPEPLLALGYGNGRVALTSLKQTYDPLGLVGREFVPKYPRVCNSVSWSHVETNMLAVAMEKHRSDHCILLWDVNRGLQPARATKEATITESPRPLAEMGLSETAHSVSWLNCTNRTLIASMNLKFIKIFDLRDWSNKAVNMTTSRYCYGAIADPLNPCQLASRADGVACVWDTRALHAPLLTLQHQRHIQDMQWCPTRRNLLLTLQRDSTSIRLHDIQQASASGSASGNSSGNGCASGNHNEHSVEELGDLMAASAIEAGTGEVCGRGGAATGAAARALQRDVTPGGTASPPPVAAFSCHPTDPRRLLAATNAGGIIEYTVCERVTVAWSGGGGGGGSALVWAGGGGGGGGALRMVPDDYPATAKDISFVMKRRAHTDYGLKADLWQNADLADDEELSNLWHFLALSKSLVEDGCIRGAAVGCKHPGVVAVLRGEGGGYRSEMVPSLLPDLPNRRVTLYRSAERQRALQLCGWGWGWENAGAGVERAEAEGTPCRAAALAAFHLRVRAALDVLARAHEPQLRVAALALAGLSEERLWREAVVAAAPALPDPYLRALTYFLAASAPAHPAQSPPAAAPPPPAQAQDYTAVLNETEMRLEDRVAFACMFLPDARLHEYIQRSCHELTQRGDLAGILLTGVSPEGLSLVQRWVERSGDVQSAAVLVARCCAPELLHDPRAQHWLDSYRSILDSWQLWAMRCSLDTWVTAGEGGAGGGGGAAARHVAVACTYCGKSVAGPPPRPGVRPALTRLPPPAAKMKQISSCPNCRKPLPRCAVCSLHLGTGGGAGAGAGAGAGGAAFGGWFSWCVACRHAGHAAHLLQWFSEHAECPVSSCNCRCSSLDPPDRPDRPDRLDRPDRTDRPHNI